MNTSNPTWTMKQGDRLVSAVLTAEAHPSRQDDSASQEHGCIVLHLADAAGNEGFLKLYSSASVEQLQSLDLQLIAGAEITLCAKNLQTGNFHLSFRRSLTDKTTAQIDWIIHDFFADANHGCTLPIGE